MIAAVVEIVARWTLSIGDAAEICEDREEQDYLTHFSSLKGLDMNMYIYMSCDISKLCKLM